MTLQFTAEPDRLSAFRPPVIGLAADPTAQQIQSSILAGTQVGASTAITTHSNTLGAISAGMVAMFPIPVVGPIIAALGALVGPIATLFKGCGATCVEATKIADQATNYLVQIKDAYFAQPVHYYSVQQATLQAIEQTLAAINTACSNPALGAAGQRCISERTVRGGTAPWCPTPDHRGCDYWTTYYDPIANDLTVVPDPVQAQTQAGDPISVALASVGIGTGTFSTPLFVIGGGILLLFALSGDN